MDIQHLLVYYLWVLRYRLIAKEKNFLLLNVPWIGGNVTVVIEIKKVRWILCPSCGNKTRNKIRTDTVMINYPLYCPKCKQETLIEAKNFQITVIKEPDA